MQRCYKSHLSFLLFHSPSVKKFIINSSISSLDAFCIYDRAARVKYLEMVEDSNPEASWFLNARTMTKMAAVNSGLAVSSTNLFNTKTLSKSAAYLKTFSLEFSLLMY